MGQVLPLLELQSEDGVEYSRETKTAITAKLAICRICVFVLECRLEKRLSIAFDMYSRLFESQVGQVSESKTPLVTLGGQTSALASSAGDLVEAVINTPLVSDKVAISESYQAPPEYARVILSLLLYDHQPIRVTALRLLISHFQQRADLVTHMKNSQLILAPDVAYAAQLISADLAELSRNYKWLTSPTDSARGDALKACNLILERFHSMCTVGSEVELGEFHIKVL